MLISQTSDGIERRFVQQNRFASREYVKNPQGGWEISASHVVNGTMLASHISSHSTGKTSKNRGRQQNTATHINYHPDHLGSVRLVTDEAGRIIDKPQTDAYGNPIPNKTATSTPGAKTNQNAKILQKFNFTGTHGIRYVEKIRMHNMRARWYEGVHYRFSAIDPLGYESSKFYNSYLYSSDNPISNIDPTGLFDINSVRELIKKWKIDQEERTKLCRIVSYICDDCIGSVKNGNNNTVNIKLENPPLANIDGAAYNEGDDHIYIAPDVWNTKGEIEMAYILMEELLHKFQTEFFRQFVCPGGVRCNAWLSAYKILPKQARIPQPNRLTFKPDANGVMYLRSTNIINEVWAQYAKVAALDRRQIGGWMTMTMDVTASRLRAIRNDSIMYLNSYSYKDPYLPGITKDGPDNFDNYYRIVVKKLQSLRGSFPQILLNLITNMNPDHAYKWQCK